MSPVETMRAEVAEADQGLLWAGWLPIAILPAGVTACRDLLPPWAFMWCLCIAIFAGLKWVTWRKARGKIRYSAWRAAAYLLAWPGMDAGAFLSQQLRVSAPPRRAWLLAFIKTAAGAALIWVGARHVPASAPLVRGWLGMVGMILLLHFGVFDVIAFFWETLGVNAAPIMSAPLGSSSLAEFWGKRWNLGFRQCSHDLIFTPLKARVGAGAAGFLVFIASGLIHESVISLPARGGYGLPTAYFALQGLGVAIERSALGKRLNLRKGYRGWLFTAVFTAGPVFLLFPPVFVMRVILPWLEVIHAL